MVFVEKASSPRLSRPSIRRSKAAGATVLRRFWHEHGAALLAYLVLSMALTWPLVQNFTAALTGIGDARHHLWILWHAKQAFLGQEPLFSTSLLFYPRGITLLTHALGPLAGLFALPFWPLGAEAAYNGALLVSFWLTGYCMYLLARGLGLERGVAFFAGTLLLVFPRHLAAVHAGHLDKVFLGALPLALLVLHHALNLRRSAWWAVGTAFALLLALVHSGEQFVFAGIAVGFFAVAALLTADRDQRWPLLKRSILIVASTLVVVGPLLVAILSAAGDPTISVEKSLESYSFQPDLVQFVLPASLTSRLLGPPFADSLGPYVKEGYETSVFLSWLGLLLCLVALVKGGGAAWRWMLFTLFCIILALGPELLVLGKSRFTVYKLPIILPYAFLTSLPGLSFLRTPGRFMLVGTVAFGIVAGLGLDWLIHRLPENLRSAVILLAVVLVLLENWPQPMPQETLRPVPLFYQQLAQDTEQYGVFDLPIRPSDKDWFFSWPVYYSSHYQIYQMTHGKGIAAGYLSRTYTKHPVFGYSMDSPTTSMSEQPDVLVNGETADPYAGIEFELARNGYRYVVWHKPQDWYREYKRGSWGELSARKFIEGVFAQREPLVDDELVTVYAVAPFADTASLTTTIILGNNWWHEIEGSPDAGSTWRWATSPAELLVYAPSPQQVQLEILPELIYDPSSGNKLGNEGTMLVTTNAQTPQRLATRVGEPLLANINLHAGRNVIALTLEAGNFRPADIQPGNDDKRLLSFALARINLITE